MPLSTDKRIFRNSVFVIIHHAPLKENWRISQISMKVEAIASRIELPNYICHQLISDHLINFTCDHENLKYILKLKDILKSTHMKTEEGRGGRRSKVWNSIFTVCHKGCQ